MIIVFLVLLCFFSVHQLNAVIIELPPKTPAFTTEFRFDEAEEGKNRVSVTVYDGTDLKLISKGLPPKLCKKAERETVKYLRSKPVDIWAIGILMATLLNDLKHPFLDSSLSIKEMKKAHSEYES